MRRQFLRITVLTAALAVSASITSFAGWVQDDHGWAYQNDDGSWRGAGWLTDPADGSIYYLDPDGYRMTDTHVEGFRLGPDGRRIEKTEEELAKEAERKREQASRPSPSKELTAAELAANETTSSSTADSTSRLSYQAEMKKLMDIIFIDARKQLPSEMIGDTTEDNLEVTYRYLLDGKDSIVSSLWKSSNPSSYNYVAHALDLSYNRNAVPDEAVVQTLDATFRRLMVAALGEGIGNALLDNIFAENANGNHSFEWTGYSDTGNSYVMNCNNGTISIQVTCSEKPVEDFLAEQAAQAAAQDAAAAQGTEAAAQ